MPDLWQQETSADLGAPLRNRTVDLLLAMATPSRPQRASCKDSTPVGTESTECTPWSLRPVHDSFHDLRATPGDRVTRCEHTAVAVRDRARVL
jgi:hypothetical protein